MPHCLSILLIEDHAEIAQQVINYLTTLGWQCDYAASARQGLALGLQQIYDVIVLDLGLPDDDGLNLCQQLRQQASYEVPLLILTARDAMADKQQAFSFGADDYLTKPFDLRELGWRCQALSRRQQLHQQQQIQLGALQLWPRLQQASYQNQSLQLTQIGFKILLLLVQHYPQALSRSLLQHQLWGDELPDSDALKSHIYSLRKALLAASGQDLLHTIRQVGYQLQLPTEA